MKNILKLYCDGGGEERSSANNIKKQKKDKPNSKGK